MFAAFEGAIFFWIATEFSAIHEQAEFARIVGDHLARLHLPPLATAHAVGGLEAAVVLFFAGGAALAWFVREMETD